MEQNYLAHLSQRIWLRVTFFLVPLMCLSSLIFLLMVLSLLMLAVTAGI